MTYAIAKIAAAAIDAELSAAGAALKAIPGVGSGPMGLTPDAVKFSPEYRTAKSALDAAKARSRAFYAAFSKRYAKEIRADRDAARAAKLAA